MNKLYRKGNFVAFYNDDPDQRGFTYFPRQTSFFQKSDDELYYTLKTLTSKQCRIFVADIVDLEKEEIGATTYANEDEFLVFLTDNFSVCCDTNIVVNGKHSELILDDGTNPHGTTQSDVGLANVDNTSDLDKPISNATQTALNWKLESGDNVSELVNDANYLQTVATDATITGDGTAGNPLSAVPSVGSVQSVTGAIVDNTDRLNPIVNMLPFTEESTIIAGSNTGVWLVRNLGLAYANKEIEMMVYSANGNQTFNVGVRIVGSTVPKFFPLRIGSISFTTVADATGSIEILSGSNNNTFEVIGTRLLQ